MLTLAGEANAAARAKAILDFETKIAKVHWTRVDSRDATKTYNKMTLAAAPEAARRASTSRPISRRAAPKVDELHRRPAERVHRHRRADRQGAACGAEGPAAGPLARQLFAPYLPKAFDDENFAFYGTTLIGTPEQEAALEARRRTSPPAALGDDVSKLYVAKYFPPETKAAADELVKNVIAAMGRRIDKLDLDEPGDQGEGAGQARRLHAEDRLSATSGAT